MSKPFDATLKRLLEESPNFANHVLRGAIAMEESSTYQWVLEQGALRGALREAQKNLLLVGHARFRGTPPEVKKAIEAITDVAHLEDLLVRSQNAASWQELLGLPEPARRSTRRKPKA